MLEMEKLADEYSTTYAAAQHYIHAQKAQSSESSKILSIDLLRRMSQKPTEKEGATFTSGRNS